MENIFSNPKFQSKNASQFFKNCKENGIKTTLKEVKEFLQKQFSVETTKEIKKEKVFNSVFSYCPRDVYQMDLMIYERFTTPHGHSLIRKRRPF